MFALNVEETESPTETVERWASDYIRTTELSHKLAPPPVPKTWTESPIAIRLDSPGRPSELVASTKKFKRPGPDAMRDPHRRAELLHTFFHHELQATELMCRALLLFADSELPFRRGLLKIALDEIRHMAAYQVHIEALGHRIGDFPVRDWFWERIPTADTPTRFVAALGIGFEGANLDHTQRFAEAFRSVGDEEGARLQERIGDEEVPHVHFAAHWLERWSGPLEFDRWRALLPRPLSPILMRGTPLDRARRSRAGMDSAFLDQLETWQPI